MRTIEIHFENRVIEVGGIPDEAKITYGGVRPDQPGTRSNTLRIYKSSRAENQLAVFRDVVWFRDKSLSIKDLPKPGKDFADWVGDR